MQSKKTKPSTHKIEEKKKQKEKDKNRKEVQAIKKSQ